MSGAASTDMSPLVDNPATTTPYDTQPEGQVDQSRPEPEAKAPSAKAPSSSLLGPLVRLHPKTGHYLPAHPDLAKLQGDTKLPDLRSFLTNILAEAETFMTSYLGEKFKEKSTKPSPPSKTQVKLLQCVIPAHDIAKARVGPGVATDEHWFARESVHQNSAASGTASWAEFEACLLDEHSRHEKDYTPDVYDAYQVLAWDTSAGVEIAGWTKVTLAIYEMAHHIPPPLNNRVFPVVVCTARHAAGNLFLVVQAPVDISKVSKALYSNGSHRNSQDENIKKAVTMGQYCSIERVEMADDMQVKWQMATASDAKGVLPMWAQKMGVPSAVVKDVGLALEWIQKRRGG